MARELIFPLVRRLSLKTSTALLVLTILLILVPTNVSRLGYITEITHVRLESLGAVYVVGFVISDRGEGWLYS